MIIEPGTLGATLSAHPAAALAAVYAGGVLTSLTPCLYPMIPVTVSIVTTPPAKEPEITCALMMANHVVEIC